MVRISTMRQKPEMHDAVLLIFKQDGVPLAVIVDGSKKQTMGQFRNKFCKAGSWLQTTKPQSPWQKMAESAIGSSSAEQGKKWSEPRHPCLVE